MLTKTSNKIIAIVIGLTVLVGGYLVISGNRGGAVGESVEEETGAS